MRRKGTVAKMAGEYAGNDGRAAAGDSAEARKNLLLEEMLLCIREGNVYQAGRYFDERNALEISGILEDGLTEYKYDLVSVEGIIRYMMREEQMSGTMMDVIHAEFLRAVERAVSIHECSMAMENAIQSYGTMNQKRDSREYSSLVQKILLAVDADLKRPLTLQYFSEVLSVNGSYLSNLFRREVGMTITEYVTSRRIEHAKGLLSMSRNPIKTVAKQAGIPDVQYFSRIFKRYTGMTPSQYREKKTYCASKPLL